MHRKVTAEVAGIVGLHPDGDGFGELAYFKYFG
jgi:hypothetical protein